MATLNCVPLTRSILGLQGGSSARVEILSYLDERYLHVRGTSFFQHVVFVPVTALLYVWHVHNRLVCIMTHAMKRVCLTVWRVIFEGQYFRVSQQMTDFMGNIFNSCMHIAS